MRLSVATHPTRIGKRHLATPSELKVSQAETKVNFRMELMSATPRLSACPRRVRQTQRIAPNSAPGSSFPRCLAKRGERKSVTWSEPYG